MPTGKIPAKRAPKLSPDQRKKLLVPWSGDGPIDDDLAHKLAGALLGKTKASSGDDAATKSDSEET